MNTHVQVSNFVNKSEEVPFEFEELFFSRTDGRGVIEAGNEVFRRVSCYDWDELVGAPHKIIRHQDMPKGVFYIMWERLQRGLPTGAYVKNKSKDGRYYWVFAVISPFEDGYVSVRLKPSSKVFETVEDAYSQALKAEQEDGLSPEESAARIREMLRELGFPTYAAFGSYALAHETAARDGEIGKSEDGRIRSLKSLLPELRQIDKDQRDLFVAFDNIRGIPSNMRIVASRLEPAGGPISAISQNYRLMSNEVTDHLGAFMADDGNSNLSESILARVYEALFIVSTARLQREVRMIAEESLKAGKEREGFEEEVKILNSMLDFYSKNSATKLSTVFSDIARLMQSSRDLRQLVTGLDSIRVLCRVEAGRLGSNSAALTPVIDQLDKFHVEIDSTLERILHHADVVKDLVEAAMPRSSGRKGSAYGTADRDSAALRRNPASGR